MSMGHVIVVLLCLYGVLTLEDAICRDPNSNTVETPQRKYVSFSCTTCPQSGIGNNLIAFPASYMFGASSGRDMIIDDRSLAGHFCKIYKCRYPFLSDVLPLKYSRQTVKNDAFINNFMKENIKDMVVTSKVFKNDASEWINKVDNVTHCLSSLSNCIIGDLRCYERFAFSKLLIGPFSEKAIAHLRDRLRGLTAEEAKILVEAPFAERPRFDAAIHIRNGFASFESFGNHSRRGKKETEIPTKFNSVAEEGLSWIQSEEGQLVYRSIADALGLYFCNSGVKWQQAAGPSYQRELFRRTAADGSRVPLVLVCADSAEVKAALIDYLRKNTTCPVWPVFLEPAAVVHTKNAAHMQGADSAPLMTDMAFDWIAMSSSNIILGWRCHFTLLRSSFVLSADRASSSNIETDGLTKVYYLSKNVQGNSPSFWSRLFANNFPHFAFRDDMISRRKDAPFATAIVETINSKIRVLVIPNASTNYSRTK